LGFFVIAAAGAVTQLFHVQCDIAALSHVKKLQKVHSNISADLAQRVPSSVVSLCRFFIFGTRFFIPLLATALFLGCPSFSVFPDP